MAEVFKLHVLSQSHEQFKLRRLYNKDGPLRTHLRDIGFFRHSHLASLATTY